MPRSGRVSMMQTYDNMEIPDEFVMSVKGSETETFMEYEEVYYEPREQFEETEVDSGDGETEVKSHYEEGKGIIKMRGMGTRREILLRALREIVLQAKFYCSDEEIEEIMKSIRVWREAKV